jgi:polysaccharide pyruvyl transferase CsaB
MVRAVLCGYYGQGNGGDEALLSTLLQMLPDRVSPIVLSGNPTQTRDRYGVAAVDRKNLGQVLGALRQSQAFIWGGGSLMQDVTSLASPVYYAGLMKLAQKLGLITIAWAQGIGPLRRSATYWMAQRTFTRCTAVSVRDQVSASLLAGWQAKFTLAPDPVWALEATPVVGLEAWTAPRVAVNLRSHPRLTPNRLAALTQALIAFQSATETGLLLLPFQRSQDLAVAEALQPQLPGPSQILMLEDPQQLKGVFRSVEMTIAMRFHGLIMAAAEGCRCFALSYDPKVSQLMQALDFPGWELEHIPSDPQQIARNWVDLYTNGDRLAPDQLKFLIDRALIHRQVLHQALETL